LGLIGIEQPTMAFTLRRMERDGIIERSPDPEHGRKSLVKLTARAARDPTTPGPDLRL
jgi:DNA-binding MarR family transcriptional regulator